MREVIAWQLQGLDKDTPPKTMQERGNSLLKTIDRYLGIPLIFCLGLLRKKKYFR